MPIIKKLTLAATGGVAECHVVRVVSIDYLNTMTSATLVSYVSQDTFEAGKQPATFEMLNVGVNGLPAPGQDPKAFVEAELVRKTIPEEQNLAGNRALFEDGVVV